MCNWRILTVLLYIALLGGCNDTKVNSSDVSTARIYTEFEVSQYNVDEVVVQARLREDGATSSTYVDLNNGDLLVTSVGGSLYDVILSNDLFSSLNNTSNFYQLLHGGPTDTGLLDILFPFSGDYSQWYSARMPYSDDTQAIMIGLYRQSYPNSLKTSVTMPPKFQILEPADGSAQASDSDLQVTWDNFNSSYTLRILVESACQSGTTTSEYNFAAGNDIGYANIAAGDLHPTGAIGGCFVTISLDRRKAGTLDPAYLGGSIYSHQLRTFTITVP